MNATEQRETLASTGEHVAALLLLGNDYTKDEYIEAITAAREVGIGEAYADKVLGTDVDAIVTGVEQDRGEEIVRATERQLRSRGIDPKKASYREFADALAQVSS